MREGSPPIAVYYESPFKFRTKALGLEFMNRRKAQRAGEKKRSPTKVLVIAEILFFCENLQDQ